jgi:integrase
MGAERKAEQSLASKLREIGPSPAVDRFLRKYGNVRTKATYALELALYLRWLKSKGVSTSPDGLVEDNLRCVFESKPTDVSTKRRHTDLLSEYVNSYLVEKDYSEQKRACAASAIRGLYKSNDSPLFGDYAMAQQAPEAPAKPLYPEDIRKVLKAMPVRCRAPLVVAWQTGIEINRVLSMKFPEGGAPPLKVELYGRKGHRKAYWTYAGADSLEHLKLVREGGFSGYGTTLRSLHRAARRLGKTGLLKNPDLASWHPHALRHSFSTECSHAGVKPEVREFFMGHVSGIAWVYQHPELHEADILAEYRKVEPYVSLDYTEAALRGEYDEREANIIKELVDLRRKVDRLLSQPGAAGQSGPANPPGPGV